MRFQLLQANVALNKLSNVTCLHCAAGSKDGQTSIFEPDHSFGPHDLDVSQTAIGGVSFQVDLHTVDSVLSTVKVSPLTLIKIDVEGFETDVINGMKMTLSQSRVPVIFEALNHEALAATAEALKQFDYRVIQLDEHNYLAESDQSLFSSPHRGEVGRGA